MPAKLTYSLDEKKLARIQKKLGPAILMPPTSRLIRDMADLAQEEAFRNAPRDTGALAADIGAQVTPMMAKVSTDLPYARPVEGGRKPLVAGGKMPPPDALRRIAAPGTEFALARSIMRRGIRGRFFFRKARTKATRELPRLARKAADEIAALWASDTAVPDVMSSTGLSRGL